jgi:hypothetical protein
MSRVIPAAGAGIVALGLAPGAAGAASIAPAEPCARYASGFAGLAFQGDGYAPNATVTFSVDGRAIGSAVTDPAGTVDTSLAPIAAPSPGGRTVADFELTADDGQGHAAAAPLKVVDWTVELPRRAQPSRRVPYRVSGFPTGLPLYLHVLRGKRVKGSFRLGVPRGDCGLLTKRLRFMPLEHYRTGSYVYAFSARKRFTTETAYPMGLRISITRVLR